MMVGFMVGSLLGGRVGDKLGRKNAMFVATAVNIPCIIASGFIPNYHVYVVLRFITCACLPVIWVTSHTYGLEYFSPKHRKVIICIKDIPINAYVIVLVIYLNRHWAYMHLWVGLISCLALPAYFFVPESPRWLASNNRKDEAEEIFKQIAKTNGRELGKTELSEIKDILDEVNDSREDRLSPLDMFRPEHLGKTLILILCWNTIVVGFYALTLNATKLHGDAVLNFLLSTLMDTPVFFLLYFVLDGWGRRYTMVVTQFVLGASCMILAFIPKYMSTGILITYLIGKNENT